MFLDCKITASNQPPPDKQAQREHNEHAEAFPHLRVAHRSCLRPRRIFRSKLIKRMAALMHNRHCDVGWRNT
jgi:hypothetical protein